MITAPHPASPKQVARHYDELDRFYRQLWGPHVHHGLWRNDGESPQQAVAQLIETAVGPLKLKPGMRICDVGCGYGETARYLAEKYQVLVTGITISPSQYQFACPQTPEPGNPAFRLGDWIQNGLASDSFDRIISIECLAHIVDKQAFFDEIARVLKPGGRAVIAAWLEGGRCRNWQRRWLMEPICHEGRLPSMGNSAEYMDMAKRAGLQMTGFEELGQQVRKRWRICSRRVLTHLANRPDAWWYLIRRKSSSWVFLFSIWRIRLAYRCGAMDYGMLFMEKK